MKFSKQCRFLLVGICASMMVWSSQAVAAEKYNFDIKGMHAFIQFKVKHLGYSWELGQFKKFDGNFSFDEKNQENNRVNLTIDIASLDTNHALRDKHLRGEKFFDAATFPTATFKSTGYQQKDERNGTLTGIFTLRGVSKTISFELHQIGAGNDPWGGFRRGFEGSTTLHLSDYNMKNGAKLGPVSENIEIYFSIEGVRQ